MTRALGIFARVLCTIGAFATLEAYVGRSFAERKCIVHLYSGEDEKGTHKNTGRGLPIETVGDNYWSPLYRHPTYH